MNFQGAVVTEQGETFAIAIIEKHIIDNPVSAKETIKSIQHLFPGMPVMLMAQNPIGIPVYFGRPDIAKFLANVAIDKISWQEYAVG